MPFADPEAKACEIQHDEWGSDRQKQIANQNFENQESDNDRRCDASHFHLQ